MQKNIGSEKMRAFLKRIFGFWQRMAEHHVSAYAAQAAFFWVLSLIPIILLLLTLVQFTPITKADVMTAAYEFFPASIRMTMISIINEVYNQSRAMIPLTALVALWSSGRGTLAVTKGLNCIYNAEEAKGYIYLRVRSALYTIVLVVLILLTLILLGFGNSISLLVKKYIPVFSYVTDFIIEIRTVGMICILILFSLCIYKFLPNNGKKQRKLKNQLAGAIFTAFGWTLTSFVISVYMDVFKGFSNMYGSLTTIVLIMLWLYFSMYIMLIGGEINVLIEEHLDIEN